MTRSQGKMSRVDDTDYPRLIAQFESLQVDQAFAEATYQAAMMALDAARSNASRQSLYLANFIPPTLAQRAEYPKKLQSIAPNLLFMSMIWVVMALIYYSLRDRGSGKSTKQFFAPGWLSQAR